MSRSAEPHSDAIDILRPTARKADRYGGSPTSVLSLGALSDSLTGSISSDGPAEQAIFERRAAVAHYTEACSALISHIHEARAMHGVTVANGSIHSLVRVQRSLATEGLECSAAALKARRSVIALRRDDLGGALRNQLLEIDAIKDSASKLYSKMLNAVQDQARIPILLGATREASEAYSANDEFFEGMRTVHETFIDSAEMTAAMHRLSDTVKPRQSSPLMRMLLPEPLAKSLRHEDLDLQRSTRALGAHANSMVSVLNTLDAESRRVVPLSPAPTPYLHKGVGIVTSKIAYVMALQSSLRLNSLLAEIAADAHLTPEAPNLMGAQ